MPDVMTPADRCSISRLAVPFQFCIFGAGLGDASLDVTLHQFISSWTISRCFQLFTTCSTIWRYAKPFAVSLNRSDAMLNGFLLSCTICRYATPLDNLRWAISRTQSYVTWYHARPFDTKIWYINRVDNVNWPPYRDWKADVSSVSPSSEQIDELWVV